MAVNEWSSGLCDCCSEGKDCGTCLCSCFIPCMQFGLNYHALSDKGNMQGVLSRWLPDATANEVCCIYTLICCVGGGGGGAAAACCGDAGGSGAFGAMLPLLWQCEQRSLIRDKYGIPGDQCSDCCTVCCCSCCALMQAAAQLKRPLPSPSGKPVASVGGYLSVNHMHP